MGIDPNDLGPPVYKEDQVITENDLMYLSQCYRHNEAYFRDEEMPKEEFTCCISHQVVEAIYEWLKRGKEKGEISDGQNPGADPWFS